MDVRASGEQVLTRIGFTERWLHRARQQCAEGHLARSVLTLVLADAEMHHAMEVAGMPPLRRVRRRWSAIGALAAAALSAAAGAVLLAGWLAPAEPIASSPPPPAVQLAPMTGELLRAIGSTGPAAPASVAAGDAHTFNRAPTALAGALPTTTAAPFGNPVAPQLAASRRSAQTSAWVPSTPVGVPTAGYERAGTSALSLGELIDLVLAAERTLRSEPTSRYSP